jgi:N-methylhydantoinase A
VIARGIAESERVPESIDLSLQGSGSGTTARKVYFGAETGWVDTSIIGRGDLDEAGAEGPLVVEEYDSTVVVPPGWRASIDSLKDIALERTGT